MYDTARHDDKRNEEVCNGKRHEKVVSDALEFLFDADGDADKHVSGDAGHDEHEEETDFPLVAVMRNKSRRLRRVGRSRRSGGHLVPAGRRVHRPRPARVDGHRVDQIVVLELHM